MKIVLFCWKSHRFLVFLGALLFQSGPALAVTHCINQRKLVLCRTLPPSFTTPEGAAYLHFN